MKYRILLEHGSGFSAIDAVLVFPSNIQDLLDESLDQAVFTCYNSDSETISVSQAVRMDIYESNTLVKTLYYTVADDESVEYPVGSGKYKHTLTVAEPTKDLEGIYCQTMTFTNSLPVPTTKKKARLHTFVVDGISTPSYDGKYFVSLLETPQFGATYTMPTPNEIGNAFRTENSSLALNPLTAASCDYDTLEESGTISGDNTQSVSTDTGVLNLTYKFNYTGKIIWFYCSLSLFPAKAEKPTKKWTIASVCERIFDLAEPIYVIPTQQGETRINNPRFVLDSADEAELSKILAPEFTMAQSTLREALKVVGGRIHAEPRAKEIYFANSQKCYKIGFDYYNKHEKADLPSSYIINQSRMDISNYCTRIISNAKNIVSSLNGGATRTERFKGVRAEQTNIRISDTNAICKTQEPIYDILSVKCKIIDKDGVQQYPASGSLDITNYCYESTIYDSVLYAAKDIYPDSKSYALRWERGSKNITQLFYQAPNAVSLAFSKYAIVNILTLASDVGQTSANDIEDLLTNTENQVCFQVVYKPITNANFIHEKNEYSRKPPFTTAYNQTDTLVELDYYGENIRGAVERLGNPEKILTAVYSTFASIPEVGKIFTISGKEYYITSRTIEMQATHYKVSFSITKDFNRISQYVGIDSQKRISEIPVNQSYDRDVILPVKLVIGTPLDTPITPRITIPMNNYRKLFTDIATSPVTQAMIYDDEKRYCIPAMATGYGTTTVLTASMKDNYAVGEGQNFVTGDNTVKGFWQKDIRFGDYFGRVRSTHIAFAPSIDTSNIFAITAPNTTANIPANAVKLTNRYLMRKDSRERISTICFSITAQTSIDGLTLGSGIAKLNGLVSSTENLAKIYFVPENDELPYKLDDSIIDYNYGSWQNATLTPSDLSSNTFYLEQVSAPIAGKGFVIAMPVTTSSVDVVNDAGVIETQTIYTGGEILMIYNKPFSQSATLLGTEYTFRIE